MGFSDNSPALGGEDPVVAPDVEPTAEERPSAPEVVEATSAEEEHVDEDIIVIDDELVEPTAPLKRSIM